MKKSKINTSIIDMEAGVIVVSGKLDDAYGCRLKFYPYGHGVNSEYLNVSISDEPKLFGGNNAVIEDMKETNRLNVLFDFIRDHKVKLLEYWDTNGKVTGQKFVESLCG